MTKRKKSLVGKMATRTLPHIIDPAMSRPPYSLKGADLDVFADLWYYSRNKPFNGSYQHLADWIEVPKTTLIRSIRYLEQKGLVDVISINAHRTSFQAKALEGHPLPVYQFHCIGLVGQNGVILNQFGPRLDQNGPYNNNIYNTNLNKKTYKRENLDNGINTLEHARAIEEQMREENRLLRDKHDKEASTPEALAARDAFFEKFGIGG